MKKSSSPSIPSIPSQSDKSVKFTPGPWKYIHNHPGVADPDGNFIADIMFNYDGNGHLMAAAPEMFTALMEVLNWYNAFTPHATGRMFVPDDMIEKVLKALQKARGEQ